MSQPCRWVSRIARSAVALGTVVLFGAGALAAQGTTGKIEGTVRDQAGAPVAGAQVLIVGSAFAGVSNEQGYYFINNVPAGLVTLRAQYIGYAPAEVRGVRVLAGQTHTQPLTLSQQAVTVEGIEEAYAPMREVVFRQARPHPLDVGRHERDERIHQFQGQRLVFLVVSYLLHTISIRLTS